MDTLPLLYTYRRCPYAMRARMALLQAGVAFDAFEIVLRDKPAELMTLSPKGTVPVLRLHDGSVLEQSLDIMRWALGRNDPMRWLEPGLDAMLALVAECDGDFKHHLDRTKYPQRYADADMPTHRAQAGEFVSRLEARLQVSRCLFADHPALADFAIAPFVRQYAQVDAAWFAAQPWPRMQTWLAELQASAVWSRVMDKYPQWVAGAPSVLFPPA